MSILSLSTHYLIEHLIHCGTLSLFFNFVPNGRVNSTQNIYFHAANYYKIFSMIETNLSTG